MVHHRDSWWSKLSAIVGRDGRHPHSVEAGLPGGLQRPKSNCDTCKGQSAHAHSITMFYDYSVHFKQRVLPNDNKCCSNISVRLHLYATNNQCVFSHLLHCFNLAFCTRALDRVPPWRMSFCPSTKQSFQGGDRPSGTTRVRGE